MNNQEILEQIYKQIYELYEQHISSQWLNVEYCESYLENLYKVKEGLERLIELEKNN